MHKDFGGADGPAAQPLVNTRISGRTNEGGHFDLRAKRGQPRGIKSFSVALARPTTEGKHMASEEKPVTHNPPSTALPSAALVYDLFRAQGVVVLSIDEAPRAVPLDAQTLDGLRAMLTEEGRPDEWVRFTELLAVLERLEHSCAALTWAHCTTVLGTLRADVPRTQDDDEGEGE